MQALYNQLIYFAFFQSLFLLIIYSFSSKLRRRINFYLVVLVGALFLGLCGKVLYISEVFGKTHDLIIISEFAGMLFGATIFLFLRSLVKKSRFQPKDLIHYVPAIIYTILVLIYFVLPDAKTMEERLESGEVTRVIYIFFSIGISINIYYWFRALFEYHDFKKNMLEEASYDVQSQFLRNLLIVTGTVMFIWFIVYILCLTEQQYLYSLIRQSIWLSLAFIILFIAFYGLKSPEVFKINPISKRTKYAQSKLSTTELDQLKADLENFMLSNKPYLNNKLLKAELAEMIGLSNPDLARLLNEKIGMNFFEYINYYRIKEFVELSKREDSKNLTFFGIAQDAGFNSKTTFNKSFKKIMGSSPTEYFNK